MLHSVAKNKMKMSHLGSSKQSLGANFAILKYLHKEKRKYFRINSIKKEE